MTALSVRPKIKWAWPCAVSRAAVRSALREPSSRQMTALGLEGTVSEHRRVKLFRKDRDQAVRIPVEFELPGDEAIMHRDGDRLVIEPVRKRGLVALLKSMKPLDETFPEIEDPC
jgi:antitoxin VapB